MVTVKIHGMDISTCTNRVVVVCNELGIKYEIITVNLMKGEHQQPDFRENMQPLGLVPVLEDEDGTKIYESRAIARYLTAKYGKDSGLMPSVNDLTVYGLFEQAASLEYSAFDPSAARIGKERVVHKQVMRIWYPDSKADLVYRTMGIPANEALANSAEEILKSKLEGYDRILSKQKYLAGDHVTLADLFHLPTGSNLDRYNPDIMRSNPNVKRWWEDIKSRDSWKGVHKN